MKNVYAVINPSTKFVIGYVFVPTEVDVSIPVSAFAVETVSDERRNILDVILADNTYPEFKYEESKYKLLDVKNETNYGIIVNGKEYRILTDNSVLQKLKDKIVSLDVSDKIKETLISLSTRKDNFILKTFKDKPFDKVRLGDVIILEDKLLHVLNIGEEELNVREVNPDFSLGEPLTIKVKSVFRVGRF